MNRYLLIDMRNGKWAIGHLSNGIVTFILGGFVEESAMALVRYFNENDVPFEDAERQAKKN